MQWILDFLGGPRAEFLVDVLFHFAWQGLAIGVVTAAALFALRHGSASKRYAAACAGLLLTALAPPITALWLAASTAAPNVATATPVTVVSADAPVVDASPATVTMPLVDTLPLAEAGWEAWTVLAWCIGVVVLSAWNLFGFVRSRRLRKRHTSPPPAAVAKIFAALVTRLGIARRCALRISELIEVPSVVGHLKPIVLLPVRALTGLSEAQIEALLAHELAHVRRHDYLVNLLQVAVETVFFFHPVVWWMSARVREEREFCCDDIAVASCEPLGYARSLAAMEELRHERLAIAASGGALLARIRRVLGQEPPRRGFSLSTAATILLFGSLLCCASWQDVAPLTDRAEFAKKMARVEVGMKRAEVIEILGKPDDVVTRKDKVVYTSGTKAILGYGNGRNMKPFVRDGQFELRRTRGTHLSFATLGRVYLDADDRVQYLFGQKPYTDTGLAEPRLRELLELLDEATPYRIGPYAPRAIIEVTNALHALGKKQALDVIAEYLRVNSRLESDAEEGLFLVLRCLFEVPAAGHHPRMAVGAPYPAEPADKSLFPRFPIALVDDVPYLLVNGYALAGQAEPLENHVAHFREHGVLRKAPLRPAARGQAPFDALVTKVRKHMQHPGTVVRHLNAQYRGTTGQEVQDKPALTRVVLPKDRKSAKAILDKLEKKNRLALNFTAGPLKKVLRTVDKLYGGGVVFIFSPKSEATKVTIALHGSISRLEVLEQLCKKSDTYATIRADFVHIQDATEFRAKAKAGTLPGEGPKPAYQPKLEFRMLAYPSAKHLKGVDLAAEKKRLVAWLDKGTNRVDLRQNPLRIASYHGLSAKRGGRLSRDIRWFPHRVIAHDEKAFGVSYSSGRSSGTQIVPVFSQRRFDAGPKSKTDFLIEFVPIDVKGRGFGHADLLWKGMRRGLDPAGQPALFWAMKDDSAERFAAMTEKNINKSMAILLDGYVAMAPTIRSRIPGRGMISGLSKKKIDEILEATRK